MDIAAWNAELLAWFVSRRPGERVYLWLLRRREVLLDQTRLGNINLALFY